MTRSAFLDNRTDYDTAYRRRLWPLQLVDYFDDARGNLTAERRYSYAEMAERSDRMANFLRGMGVGAATGCC
jgi:acetyl-CoA synthetase